MRWVSVAVLFVLMGCRFPNGTAACIDACATRAACGFGEVEQNCLTDCLAYVEWAEERGKRCSRNVREEIRCIADVAITPDNCELLAEGVFRDDDPCFRPVAQSDARCGELEIF